MNSVEAMDSRDRMMKTSQRRVPYFYEQLLVFLQCLLPLRFQNRKLNYLNKQKRLCAQNIIIYKENSIMGTKNS